MDVEHQIAPDGFRASWTRGRR
jgi:hypothetical protein